MQLHFRIFLCYRFDTFLKKSGDQIVILVSEKYITLKPI